MTSPSNNNLVYSYTFSTPLPQSIVHAPSMKRTFHSANFTKVTEQKNSKKRRFNEVSQNIVSVIQTNPNALNTLQPQSSKNFAITNFLLGLSHEVAGSDALAFAHYQVSTTKYHLPEAFLRMGHLYETGRGTFKSDYKAFKCYQKAANLKDETGMAASQLLDLKHTQN